MQNASPDQGTGLGAQLAAARARAGWTVPEVARRLHIIPRYVEAIEEEQWQELPGAVFLKGYVRSYARLLGLPEEPTSRALEQALQARPELFPRRKVVPPPSTGGIQPASIVIGLAILAMIGLVLWYVSGQAPSEVVPERGVAEQEAALAGEGRPHLENENLARETAIGAPRATINDAAEAEGWSAEDPVQAGPNPVEVLPDSTGSNSVSTDPDSISPAAKPAKPPVSPSQVQAGSADRALEQLAPLPQHPEQLEEGVRSTVPEPAGEPGPAVSLQPAGDNKPAADRASAGELTVEVRFSGDCWFDIRGADNRRKVGLYRNGESWQFVVTPPARVIAGAASEVSMLVNGKFFDLSRYAENGKRAEFVLEQ